MKEEVWKIIEGWYDYEVSNLGRVKSSHRCNNRKSGTDIVSITNKPTRTGKPSLKVSLRDNGVRRWALVKKLVATAFLPPPSKDELYIKHKDGDGWNCEADNLYYTHVHPNSEIPVDRRKKHTASVSL